jgi:Telomere-capping, CST complex subunit
MLRSATILSIKEILQQESNVIGRYVRVTGCMEFYDLNTKLAICTYESNSILIDIELADISSCIPTPCLCQFFGEIYTMDDKVLFHFMIIITLSTTNYVFISFYFIMKHKKINSLEWSGSIYLKARIARNVSGLDINLFEQAVATRRDFLRY